MTVKIENRNCPTNIRFVGGPWHNRLEEVGSVPMLSCHGGGNYVRVTIVMSCPCGCCRTTEFQEYHHDSLSQAQALASGLDGTTLSPIPLTTLAQACLEKYLS